MHLRSLLTTRSRNWSATLSCVDRPEVEVGRRLRDRLLTLVMTAAVFIGTYWLGLVLFPVGLNWANRNINFQLGRDALDWIRQLGAFGVAAGAAAVTGRTALRLLSRRGREPGDELLVRAAHFLARRSLIEATHNPVRTRLYRPMPLRVRLRSVGGAIAAGRSAVTGEDNTTWEQEPIHTHVDRLLEMFLMLPQRPLVMVGEAGAGKSVMALLLTHQLLQRWHPDEPVPVL